MIRKFINILAVAAVMTGCINDSVEPTEGVGYLVVDLSCYDDESTKAEDIDLADYDVVISGPVDIACKCAELPAIIELEPGVYTIAAQSPGKEPAAFAQPIYGGDDAFEIKENETTSVKLICALLNMKVTINPSAAFLSQVKSYEVRVNNGYGELLWTPADVEVGKTGYFTVAPLTVSLTGTSVGNAPLSFDGMILDVEASDHHIISFDSF